MALLTRELLQDLGIHMDDQNYAMLEEHFETTLQERVIAEIVEELSPEQAQELATMQGAGDEQLLQWLQVNVLDLADIVSDEIDILLGELAEHSEAFNQSQEHF
jgi:tRNA A37 N6-isopentenylltransferase MiaA